MSDKPKDSPVQLNLPFDPQAKVAPGDEGEVATGQPTLPESTELDGAFTTLPLDPPTPYEPHPSFQEQMELIDPSTRLANLSQTDPDDFDRPSIVSQLTHDEAARDPRSAAPIRNDWRDPEANTIQITPSRHLTKSQKDQVARMLVSGVPRPYIAAAYNVAPSTVANWDLQQEGEWAFRKGREAAAINRSMVDLVFGMHARLPRSILHVDQDGFGNADAKIRLDTAWRVIGFCKDFNTSAQKGAQAGAAAQVNNTINVDTSGVSEATKQVAEILAELRGAGLGGALRRVKQGPEALPGPSAIAEVAQLAKADAIQDAEQTGEP